MRSAAVVVAVGRSAFDLRVGKQEQDQSVEAGDVLPVEAPAAPAPQ